jgi:hypothetical protein
VSKARRLGRKVKRCHLSASFKVGPNFETTIERRNPPVPEPVGRHSIYGLESFSIH